MWLDVVAETIHGEELVAPHLDYLSCSYMGRVRVPWVVICWRLDSSCDTRYGGFSSSLQAERQEDYGPEYLPPIYQGSHFCKGDPVVLFWILDRHRYLDHLVPETQGFE